jgi:RNA polymerase sigma factor (sigma-70 family)
MPVVIIDIPSGLKSSAKEQLHKQVAESMHHAYQMPDNRVYLREWAAYLFACVRNAVLNDNKARERDVALDEDSVWFIPPNQDYAEELNLRRALGGLPDDQRQVIILHVWGELTFSQIAQLLGISSNTAASRYRYALAKLREAMRAKEDSSAAF